MKVKLIQTVNDVYLNGGIFKTLQQKSNFEWLTEENALTYDMDYYYSRSGEKTITPLFNSLILLEEAGSIPSAIDRIADIILMRYTQNWNAIYNTYVKATYNPINDVDISVEENSNDNVTDNTTRDRTKATKTDSTTESTSSSNTQQNNENNNTNNNYGFNSITSVPADENNGNSNTTSNTDSTINDTNNINVNDTENETNDRTYNKTHTFTRTQTGKTSESSYQKMVEDELKLRQYLFINEVYKCVDDVMVLGIYSND